MASARAARRAAALGLGVLWWWAVLRLVLAPGAGVLEGTVAVGGWGLSVLPVHCVPRRSAAGALGAGRWRRALRAAVDAPGPTPGRGPRRPGEDAAAGPYGLDGPDGPDGPDGSDGPDGPDGLWTGNGS
ncbi:hypothetical protein [Streptomyces sp. AC512_CC834]|uniref:hypothetical protein n=1 Tax=Streptomyces sp. AC512_CC834 TaxID=2823691 RepID=UPI0020B81778|nr:hypothetical protein [Streptomyces sp. AC512_CC834]